MDELVCKVRESLPPERVIELTRRFCSIPSPAGEEGALAEAIADTLESAGAEVHLEEVVAGRPNVVARVPGAGQRGPLVLNGHLDASIHPGPWRHDPFDPWIEDGRLFAGGVSDMKGALSAMVAAVEAAVQFGPLPGDLLLHAVMHHDTIGLGAKYVLASEGPRSGYGICGEPSDLSIHTGNGGAVKFEIRLRGRAAHVSRREEGIDALAAANDVYAALHNNDFEYTPCERLPDLPRMLVGELKAGSAPAAIADEAVLRGDIRTVPGMDRRSVAAHLRAVVNDACPPRVSSRVRILAVQSPFLGPTEGVLIDTIAQAHSSVLGRDTKTSAALPGQAFVTDAADMAAAGIETVVYGCGDWQHAPDESVSVDDLTGSAQVYLAVAAGLR